jgi:hypothetical protein
LGQSIANFFPLAWYDFAPITKKFAGEVTSALPAIIQVDNLPSTLREKYPAYQGKLILIFVTADGFLKAYDFIADKELWRLKIPDPNLVITGNHPLLDSLSGRVFIKMKYGLLSVNLNGTQEDNWMFNPLDYLPTEERDHALLKGPITCNSGLALTAAKNERHVIYGCSSPSGYGLDRGKSGFVVGFPINENGSLSRGKKLKVFTASQKTKDPRTGFATGIWMTGAPPAVLPNGDFLVTTGNGPFLPQELNFGCSLLRVNGKTFQVNAEESAGAWYHPSKLSSVECFADNLDMSSSGPSLLLDAPKAIGGGGW